VEIFPASMQSEPGFSLFILTRFDQRNGIRSRERSARQRIETKRDRNGISHRNQPVRVAVADR
jgi:hypothetical protein